MNNEDENKQQFWDKEFKNTQPSSIKPLRTRPAISTSADAYKLMEQLIAKYDPHMLQLYNNGKAKGRVINLSDEDYSQMLEDCIICVFDTLRNNIDKNVEEVEEKQILLQRLSAAQTIFKSGIEVLNSLNLKLDINSVASILHGYTMQCMLPLLQHYEDRKDIRD